MDRATPIIRIDRFEQPEPDLGPIGFRRWRLVSRLGRTELAPISIGPSWVPSQPLEAECPKAHRAGDADCSCGFHLLHPKLSVAQDLEQAILNGVDAGLSSRGIGAAGVARGWGRVTVENEQIRTELARVEALFVHAASDPSYRNLIESLAERYEAETVEVESAAGMLAWLLDQTGVLTPSWTEAAKRTSPIYFVKLGEPTYPTGMDLTQPAGIWPESLDPPDESFQDEYRTGIEGARIVRVAGLTHHPGRLPAYADRFQPGQLLSLVPEPENPHDRHAIAVYDEAREVQLGYLPRSLARTIGALAIEDGYANLLCTWSDPSNGDPTPASAHLLLTAPATSRRLTFPD